jgi:hypothetical protein
MIDIGISLLLQVLRHSASIQHKQLAAAQGSSLSPLTKKGSMSLYSILHQDLHGRFLVSVALRNCEECLLRLSHHSTRQVVLVDRVPVGRHGPVQGRIYRQFGHMSASDVSRQLDAEQWAPAARTCSNIGSPQASSSLLISLELRSPNVRVADHYLEAFSSVTISVVRSNTDRYCGSGRCLCG